VTTTFLGILLEYENAINPEPGVKRAPTKAEQTRALQQYAQRNGGTLSDKQFVAHQSKGVKASVMSAAASDGISGVLLFSIDVLRRNRKIDTELLWRMWDATGRIGFLIEDAWFSDESSFRQFMHMVVAMNEVRDRDSSREWAELVGSTSPSS